MKKNYFIGIFFLILFCAKTNAQCSTPASIPYYENFQALGANGQLPVCWAYSNPATCTTFTGAGGYAAFYYQPAGTGYFYSKALQLNAGVTYSVSMWYLTSFNSSLTWTNLSLLLCTNQSATGAGTIASVNGAFANVMTPISNTFVVASSGVYYLAVKGVSNGSGASQYLFWDDLSITIPCSAALNTPTVSIAASATTICSGQPFGQLVMMANGADTYSWSTGATTQTITDAPGSSQLYTVIGTNTLSGCSSSSSIAIAVNPSPNVLVFANQTSVCAGSNCNITAVGATSYTWNTGQQTSFITVNPTTTINYTVNGSNSYGCISQAVIPITVNPLPVISIVSAVSSNTICNGDIDTLTASGAISYQWLFGQSLLQGTQIIVTPTVTTTFSVTGTNQNGCSSITNFVLHVNGCTGINQVSADNFAVVILPNPFQEEFLLRTGNRVLKSIRITDLSGRTVLSIMSEEDKIIINTRYYAQGIYYMTIKSDTHSSIHKLIKN